MSLSRNIFVSLMVLILKRAVYSKDFRDQKASKNIEKYQNKLKNTERKIYLSV